jgi:type I restriction enzyme S subunit
MQICPVFRENILMVMSDLPNGRALGKCFYVENDNTYTLNQRICSLSVKDKAELSSKYLFYFLNRNKQLLRYDNGVDQTNLKRDHILNISIPIPPLREQERIVSILDRFDVLTNDITSGLPAEIAVRRKQYEYYRDKLLTFD